jgi:hypothetical protein
MGTYMCRKQFHGKLALYERMTNEGLVRIQSTKGHWTHGTSSIINHLLTFFKCQYLINGLQIMEHASYGGSDHGLLIFEFLIVIPNNINGDDYDNGSERAAWSRKALRKRQINSC